ncbi:MAG: hypothetical protein ABI413_05455 [Ktedonobacteraceae bacterium]
MSDVARLRQQIADECEAGWWALHGLAAGIAQHEFITTRFKNMETHHLALTKIVGEEQATEVLCQIYNEVGNKH